MVDQVARALCEAAGRSSNEVNADPQNYCHKFPLAYECAVCDRLPDGTLRCSMWTSFREEAKAAIIAAHAWHKRERRWPSFVKS